MINISSPQNQVRQNRTLLTLIGGTSGLFGFFLWSFAPFAFSNTKVNVNVYLRYLCLVTSLGCGVTLVVTGKQLDRISPLIRAIETAEKDDFLTQLATSQYLQQQHWQQQALQPAPFQQPFQAGNVAGNDTVTDVTEPVSMKRSSGERFNQVTDTGNGSGNNPGNAGTDSYKPLYYAVTQLKEMGVSDSKIIKEVLKQQGRNFETGKQMLETLLQLGQSQGW
jgi:hypothetical protein